MHTKKQHREYMKMYRKKYPDLEMKQVMLRTPKQRRYMLKAKNKPCTDCGFRYKFWQMDFDHRNPEDKLFAISGSGRRDMDRLKAEIAKCDVVCANCHRNRTHRQRRSKFKWET